MFMSYFKILNNAKLILNNKACVLATYNTANIKHYNHPATTCIHACQHDGAIRYEEESLLRPPTISEYNLTHPYIFTHIN